MKLLLTPGFRPKPPYAVAFSAMEDSGQAKTDPAKLTRKNFDRRREEIIDLAAGLFAKHGFAGTGVAEIGEVAGLGKSGLYHYIGSKEALLVEIHERVVVPLLESAEQIEALATQPTVRLRLLSELLLRTITEQRDLVWVFFHEHRALQGELLAKFQARRRAFQEIVNAVLSDGVGLGEFVMDDTRLAAMAFLGMHNSTYQWLSPYGRLTPAEVSLRYCSYFIGGIGIEIDMNELEREVARCRAILGSPA